MMRNLLLVSISMYQYMISPILGKNCRFEPSCSRYAYDAIQKHGILAGSWVTVIRLLKCHPFHPGGVDPVR